MDPTANKATALAEEIKTLQTGDTPEPTIQPPIQSDVAGAPKAKPTLNDQVQELRGAAIKKEMDPAKSKGQGQFKRDLAGDKQSGLVLEARRIAKTLAVNGPITIDDVTEEMAKTRNVLPKKGQRKHQWKGSVFTKSEWRLIGERPSRQVSAHSRPVGLWALKSWLKTNSLNGTNTVVSAFTLTRVFSDFKRINPGVALERANWFIGEEQLDAAIRTEIVAGKNFLYEVPVTFVPSSVGALMLPPDPSAQMDFAPTKGKSDG